jgi:flotillin
VAAELAIADAERAKDVKVREYAAQVAQAEAAKDLAYDVQKAKTEQLLVNERVGVSRVEREKQIEVEELEIARREKELVHSVEKPAEAERYRIETLAGAEQKRVRLTAEADADAIRLRGCAEADVIRATGQAEAEIIRQKALAEAEGEKAKLLAEAEGMQHKAAAWEKYTAPAISQILIERLPEIAAAVAAPLERIDRITMVNTGGGDSAGIERITQGVTNILAQMPGMTELLGSVNLAEVVQQVKRAAAPQADGNGRVVGEAAAPEVPSGPTGH